MRRPFTWDHKPPRRYSPAQFSICMGTGRLDSEEKLPSWHKDSTTFKLGVATLLLSFNEWCSETWHNRTKAVWIDDVLVLSYTLQEHLEYLLKRVSLKMKSMKHLDVWFIDFYSFTTDSGPQSGIFSYHSDLVSRALLELLHEKYINLACSCLLPREKSALLLLAVTASLLWSAQNRHRSHTTPPLE